MRAESASIASPAASAASESLLPASLRWAGPLLSAGYFCGMSLHRACLAPKWAPLPTIVIGNITVGGTGKTPMTLYLGERLARLGEKPAVLMRGYKGQASDEAREIQNALKRYSVPIVIGSNRLNSAILARERGCSVALLDDGFQHWRLNRDLDIVLIDASRPFGGGHLLPQGRLREPLSGLARAGAVVITRADSVSAAGLSALKTQLARWAPTASVAVTRHRPAGLKEISGEGRLLPLARLNEGIFSPVCGIGNPRAFVRTLEPLGANLTALQALPDHCTYTAETLQHVAARARSDGASAIVTTAKDAVKIAALNANVGMPILELTVRLEFINGEEALWARVKKVISNARYWLR